MTPRTTALILVCAALAAFAVHSFRSAGRARNATRSATASRAETVFQSVCVACHSSAGEGNVEFQAPSIASLPNWYIEAQLTKFQADMRGTEPADLPGSQMRAVAHALGPDIISDLANYVAGLPRHPTQNTLGGDPAKGREFYQVHCEECHRPRASGDYVFKSPPLTGLQDWYLAAQLRKFRERVRGGHPQDIEGAKMRDPSGRFLSDEEEKDVLAYIALLADKD